MIIESTGRRAALAAPQVAFSRENVNESGCLFAKINVSSTRSSGRFERRRVRSREITIMFYAFYAIAIVILVLHFTGWLKRNNVEWIMLVLAVAVFPAVIFLK